MKQYIFSRRMLDILPNLIEYSSHQKGKFNVERLFENPKFQSAQFKNENWMVVRI